MGICADCLNNCKGVVISDKCVEYTGKDYDDFGICSANTSLFEVENVILEYLLTVKNGSGIVLDSLNTTCTLYANQTDFSLPALAQQFISTDCYLQAQINTLNTQVNTPYPFNINCLQGITSTSSRDQIIQSLINKSCDNDTRITDIENDYVKSSDLCSLVTACIGSGGGGGGGTPSSQYKDRMVPWAVYPYIGSLSNFDNTGKGLASVGFEDVYLVNGLHGLPDWRGRTPIGAIQNVPGATLDPYVDPTLPQNTGTNYTLNQKVGVSSVTLTLAQMPSHSHTVIDPGHKHKLIGTIGGGSTVFSDGQGAYWKKDPYTETSVTGITIGSSGSGLPHSNLQPSIGCYYIIYIP